VKIFRAIGELYDRYIEGVEKTLITEPDTTHYLSKCAEEDLRKAVKIVLGGESK
jgi:hypothetical protein